VVAQVERVDDADYSLPGLVGVPAVEPEVGPVDACPVGSLVGSCPVGTVAGAVEVAHYEVGMCSSEADSRRVGFAGRARSHHSKFLDGEGGPLV
jgi:hypothetical protein